KCSLRPRPITNNALLQAFWTTARPLSSHTALPGSRATGVGEGSSRQGVATVRKDLSELYWEAHGYEGLDIERFLADVQAGTWGAYTADEIRDFLYKLEAAIIDNIETKATEAPAFAAAKNEVIEQTKAGFAELRRRYASSV